MEYGTVLVWWALFQALALAGLPVAAVLGRSLPDRGAGLALPVALVLLFVPAYWVGQLTFGPVAIGIAVTTLAAVALFAAWNGVTVEPRRHLEVMLAFTLAFGLLVAVRAVDPSIHPAGGEKFLDYGLLQSTLRATRLPPADIWFAGEPVRYYYGGHLLSAILARLADTPARYAYNLALAGTYATLVATAYGVAGATAAARDQSYRVAGALGAFLVGFAGNLFVPVRRLLWALPASVARPIARHLEATTAVDSDRVLAVGEFSYWTASRVIPGTINEFPLFAFLNGDLHAHMLSTPFLLLVAGFGLAYVRTPPEEVTRRRLLILGSIPPVGGVLAVVNTWSFPTVAGVAWLALLLGNADPAELLPKRVTERLPQGSRTQWEFSRFVAASGLAAAVGVIAVLWAIPFFVGPASGRAVSLVTTPSGLLPFLLVHGAFLAIFWVGIGALVARRWPSRRRHVVGIAGAIVLIGIAWGRPAVGLLIPIIVGSWILRRFGNEAGYEAILIVAGAGLLLLIELLYVSEQAGPGRMNTVFKVSMQAWVLWGVAAGAFLPRLPDLVRGWGPPAIPIDRIAALVVGLLLVSVSLYGVLALGEHFARPADPSLDATTAAQRSHPQEWAAINALEGVSGQPHIVTAPGCWCNPDGQRPYDWVNAPSSFTGLPTVAGWSHEVGYRGEEPYDRRVADVETIYTGPWERRADLLRRYDVRYIYVGPNERALYGPVSFDGHVGPDEALTVAFRNDAVTIYAVHHDRLP